MTRRGVSAALVAVLLVVAQVGTALAAQGRGGSPGSGANAAPIDKQLQAELKAGTVTTILVEFDASADLKAPAKVKDRTQRGQAVVRALQKGYIEVEGLRGKGVEIEDFNQPRLMSAGEQASLMDRFWWSTDRLKQRG